MTKLGPPFLQFMGLRWGAGLEALPTQGRPQGLLAQHLVPWGQLSWLTQEAVQESFSEELSSGHTACSAHRMGRGWGMGWLGPSSHLPLAPQGKSKMGQRQKPWGTQSPAPQCSASRKEKNSARNMIQLTKRKSAVKIRKQGCRPTAGGRVKPLRGQDRLSPCPVKCPVTFHPRTWPRPCSSRPPAHGHFWAAPCYSLSYWPSPG